MHYNNALRMHQTYKTDILRNSIICIINATWHVRTWSKAKNGGPIITYIENLQLGLFVDVRNTKW